MWDWKIIDSVAKKKGNFLHKYDRSIYVCEKQCKAGKRVTRRESMEQATTHTGLGIVHVFTC